MNHDAWTDKALDLRQTLAGLDREARVELLQSLPESVRKKALSSPYILAQDHQMEVLNSDALVVLMLMGRGTGKTWSGTQWILDKVQRNADGIAVAGPTWTSDVVNDIVDPGTEGIKGFGEDKELGPNFQTSKKRVEFEGADARIQLFSGEGDKFRGFSGSYAWLDELANMRYPEKVYHNLGLALREGENQQLLITTTPRPLPLLKELVDDPDVHVVRGHSRLNWDNLGEFMRRKIEKMEGTRLGKQEIEGKILDAAGDLWDYEDIRHVTPSEVPEMQRICVGLDPTVSNSDDSDEAGIVVVGLGTDDVAYVLADLSGTYTTAEWGAVTVAAYKGNLELVSEWLDEPYSDDIQRLLSHPPLPRPADVIHAETNQGGELITQQLRTYGTHAAVNSTHTTQSKKVRAEPVHHLYQRSKVQHVGNLSELEDQMTDFVQDPDVDSPDRVDALVYAVNELKDLSNETDRTKEAWDTILSINN